MYGGRYSFFRLFVYSFLRWLLRTSSSFRLTNWYSSVRLTKHYSSVRLFVRIGICLFVDSYELSCSVVFGRIAFVPIHPILLSSDVYRAAAPDELTKRFVLYRPIHSTKLSDSLHIIQLTLSAIVRCEIRTLTSVCWDGGRRVSLLTYILRTLPDSSSFWSSTHSPSSSLIRCSRKSQTNCPCSSIQSIPRIKPLRSGEMRISESTLRFPTRRGIRAAP